MMHPIVHLFYLNFLQTDQSQQELKTLFCHHSLAISGLPTREQGAERLLNGLARG